MKLLVITQKVDINDPILGFFHSWLLEFARHVEKLTVICLEKGEYDLPGNVAVHSLGKESKTGLRSFRRISYILRFYYYILRHANQYDNVFVHMNPEYIALAGPLWFLMNKRIALWYVHRAVPWSLLVADIYADAVYTASKESCRLVSKKVKILGHGIDLDKFKYRKSFAADRNADTAGKERSAIHDRRFTIIYLGRISPIKNQLLLVKAVDALRGRIDIQDIKVLLVGGPLSSRDRAYERKLKEAITYKNIGGTIRFVGPVQNTRINEYLLPADLSLNLCPTGGMDKAVLESWAAGVPTIALNRAFAPYLDKYQLYLKMEDPNILARAIERVMKMDPGERRRIGQELRQVVEKNFSLDNLVNKIISDLE